MGRCANRFSNPISNFQRCSHSIYSSRYSFWFCIDLNYQIKFSASYLFRAFLAFSFIPQNSKQHPLSSACCFRSRNNTSSHPFNPRFQLLFTAHSFLQPCALSPFLPCFLIPSRCFSPLTMPLFRCLQITAFFPYLHPSVDAFYRLFSRTLPYLHAWTFLSFLLLPSPFIAHVYPFQAANNRRRFRTLKVQNRP